MAPAGGNPAGICAAGGLDATATMMLTFSVFACRRRGANILMVPFLFWQGKKTLQNDVWSGEMGLGQRLSRPFRSSPPAQVTPQLTP